MFKKVTSLMFLAVLFISPYSFADVGSKAENNAKAVIAMQFIEYGKEFKDSMALLSGVNILNELEAPLTTPNSKGGDSIYDPIELLQLAKDYSGGDEQLSKLIDTQMESVEPRDRWVCYWQWMWVGGYYQYYYYCP